MILGIDPGIRKLGYALIEDDFSIVDAGVLINKRSTNNDIQKLGDSQKEKRNEQRQRMMKIYTFFEEMLEKYSGRIDTVCVEKLYFMDRNQNNAEYVFGIRGALMMLFYRHNITLLEYTPIQLKKYITGNSKANKTLMMAVVKNLFGLQEDFEWHDTADALGLAYLAAKSLL